MSTGIVPAATDGLRVVAGALPVAAPARQADRVIEPLAGIPAVGIEQRRPAGQQFEPGREPVSTSITKGDGASGPSNIASEFA